MAWTRAQPSDVQNVVETGAATGQIQAALDAAERVLVDNVEGQGVADATMTQIHTYLGAHFLHTFDPQTAEEDIADHREKYQGSTSEGLRATWLGQMAISLDPSGELAALDERREKLRVRIGSE